MRRQDFSSERTQESPYHRVEIGCIDDTGDLDVESVLQHIGTRFRFGFQLRHMPREYGLSEIRTARRGDSPLPRSSTL
jgi:hypothetical protein